MNNSYENRIYEYLSKMFPEVRDRLEDIGQIDVVKAKQVAGDILEFACKCQNDGNIMAGRRIFRRIPNKWLDQHLSEIASQALDLSDEWDYRRLIELLHEHQSPFFEHFRQLGLQSPNPEIREAAADSVEWMPEKWIRKKGNPEQSL